MFIEGNEKSNVLPRESKSIRSPDSERRYLPRWEVHNKIFYQQKDGTSAHECYSKDISAMGTSLRTTENLKPNTPLSLTIHLADDIPPIRVDGYVRWQLAQDKENIVGIQFDRISERNRDLIFHYAFEYKREELMKRWFQDA